MSLVPKVRCKRCDRSFSSLKNKCPYCDSYRGRSGKRAFDANDAFARRMIKVLLLLALIITVVSVLLMNLDDADELGSATNPPEAEQGDPAYPPELPIFTPPVPVPSPTPEIEVTSVQISWQFWAPGVTEFTIGVGQRLDLWVNVFPIEADEAISWSIEANTVAVITQNADDHAQISLEGRGRGVTTLQVSVGGMTDEVTVRVQ